MIPLVISQTRLWKSFKAATDESKPLRAHVLKPCLAVWFALIIFLHKRIWEITSGIIMKKYDTQLNKLKLHMKEGQAFLNHTWNLKYPWETFMWTFKFDIQLKHSPHISRVKWLVKARLTYITFRKYTRPSVKRRYVHDYQCDYKVRNQNALTRHKCTKDTADNYRCDECNYKLTQKTSICKHIKINHRVATTNVPLWPMWL